MKYTVEDLWRLREVELLATYHEARRAHAEKKFARDTERARLQWLRAKAFVNGSGGVSERTNAVEANEELARKGQHVREMTHEVDLLKCDVDAIAGCLRLRGLQALSSRSAEGGDARTDDDDTAADAI